MSDTIKITERGGVTSAATEPVLPHETAEVGKWAVCSQGRLGQITGKEILLWGESWVGTGLDGTPWASRNPTIICEKDAALLPARL